MPLLKIRAVAGLFSVSTSTVRKWIADGELKAVTLPHGTVRVSQTALDKFLESNDEQGNKLTQKIADSCGTSATA